MAICNIFKEINKTTGTFLTFSQYAEDVTKQHSISGYKVVPSKFYTCNIDFSGYDNKSLPVLFQNKFENSCAILKNSDQSNWSAESTKPLFWNTIKDLIIGEELLDTDENPTGKFPSTITYIGDINIQSYSNKDSVGYNEIYCYIPNDAKSISVEFEKNQGENNFIDCESYTHICGYDTADENIKGIIELNGVSSLVLNTCEQLDKEKGGNIGYYTNYIYNEISQTETPETSFKFNTIIVLYDIVINNEVLYKDIPLGIYFTGVIEDGVMTNPVTKFVSNNDIYGVGTSYGLRICSRFTVTPNSTEIKSDVDILEGVDAEYAAFSQAMGQMAESQIKMDEVLEEMNTYNTGVKNHIMSLTQGKVNVPYIEKVNNIPYWFVNGKNTGQKIYYDVTFEGDGVVNGNITYHLDGAHIDLYHKLYDNNSENVIIEDPVVTDNEVKLNIPIVQVDKTGHVTDIQSKEVIIKLPKFDDTHLMLNDGSNYVASKDLVAHSIKPTWTIKDQDGNQTMISTSNRLELENGAKVTFEGEWSYSDKSDTTKLPESCSGNWGSELKGPNASYIHEQTDITSNTTFSQTISAPKSGLEVKNNKVVKAEGDDTSSKSVSVSFKHRIYYGASTLTSISSLDDLKTLGGTELNTTFAKTFDVDCGTGKYIYIAYPASISGEPSFKIGGLDFTNLVETTAEITNEYGLKVNYKIYRVFDIQTAPKTIVVTKK